MIDCDNFNILSFISFIYMSPKMFVTTYTPLLLLNPYTYNFWTRVSLDEKE